jgi:hypothetical protein
MTFQEEEENVLRHLYMKSIILPRQARDKHRENSKKSNSDQQACRSMRLQKIDPLLSINKSVNHHRKTATVGVEKRTAAFCAPAAATTTSASVSREITPLSLACFPYV